MFIEKDGSYKGKEYICMFHDLSKYQFITHDEGAYFQPGYEIEISCTDNDLEDPIVYKDAAILCFSARTDELIYAEAFHGTEDDFRARVVELDGIVEREDEQAMTLKG